MFDDGILIPSLLKFLDNEENDPEIFLRELKNGNLPKELLQLKKKRLKILVTDLRPLVFKSRIKREYNIEVSPIQAKAVFLLMFPDKKFGLVNDQPKCSMRVRLPDAKTHDFEVNIHTKILEIFKYLESITNLKSNEFELLYGFPLKKLEDYESSVKELNLENCVLNMNLR